MEIYPPNPSTSGSHQSALDGSAFHKVNTTSAGDRIRRLASSIPDVWRMFN